MLEGAGERPGGVGAFAAAGEDADAVADFGDGVADDAGGDQGARGWGWGLGLGGGGHGRWAEWLGRVCWGFGELDIAGVRCGWRGC